MSSGTGRRTRRTTRAEIDDGVVADDDDDDANAVAWDGVPAPAAEPDFASPDFLTLCLGLLVVVVRDAFARVEMCVDGPGGRDITVDAGVGEADGGGGGGGREEVDDEADLAVNFVFFATFFGWNFGFVFAFGDGRGRDVLLLAEDEVCGLPDGEVKGDGMGVEIEVEDVTDVEARVAVCASAWMSMGGTFGCS